MAEVIGPWTETGIFATSKILYTYNTVFLNQHWGGFQAGLLSAPPTYRFLQRYLTWTDIATDVNFFCSGGLALCDFLLGNFGAQNVLSLLIDTFGWTVRNMKIRSIASVAKQLVNRADGSALPLQNIIPESEKLTSLVTSYIPSFFFPSFIASASAVGVQEQKGFDGRHKILRFARYTFLFWKAICTILMVLNFTNQPTFVTPIKIQMGH